MATQQCEHSSREHARVEMDFLRLERPVRYSVEVSIRVCKECGHIELHAKSHRDLCDWLARRS